MTIEIKNTSNLSAGVGFESLLHDFLRKIAYFGILWVICQSLYPFMDGNRYTRQLDKP